MLSADVAIVGAGPAGTWAARTLALAGARVVIFDASHPREKPCGGGLTRRALRFLTEAGVAERVPGVAVRAVRFTSGLDRASPALVRLPHHDGDRLLVVSRKALDGALLGAAVEAGADWRAERVLDVAVSRNSVAVRTSAGTTDASFVVGADGANSLVRRRVSRPFSRGQISIATGFYAHGVTSTDAWVHCMADPPGYIWSFPRVDHAAIGICAQADATTVARLRQVVCEWVHREAHADGAKLSHYSWPIPSLLRPDFAGERPAGERWALAGDAAGLVDPLTREGIYYALRSGELAAEALSGSEAGDAYASRVRDELYPELARAAALKAGFFSSHFTDLLVEALGRSDKVRAVMGDLIAGEQPYATLKRQLLATFEFSLAWRLLALQIRGLIT